MKTVSRQPSMTLFNANVCFWSQATINKWDITPVFLATLQATFTAIINTAAAISNNRTLNCSHPCRECSQSSWNHPWLPGSKGEIQDKTSITSGSVWEHCTIHWYRQKWSNFLFFLCNLDMRWNIYLILYAEVLCYILLIMNRLYKSYNDIHGNNFFPKH